MRQERNLLTVDDQLSGRTSRHNLDLAASVRRLAIWVWGCTAVTVIGLVYRLWAQLTASVPDGAPGLWLYAATGWLVGPFRGHEIVTPVRGTAILEFAAFIALEVWLLAGVITGAVLWWLSNAITMAGNPVLAVDLDVARYGRPVRSAWSGMRAAWARADASLQRSADRGIAPHREIDWATVRDGAVLAVHRARIALGQRWESYGAVARAQGERASSRGQAWQRAANIALERGLARSRQFELLAIEEARSHRAVMAGRRDELLARLVIMLDDARRAVEPRRKATVADMAARVRQSWTFAMLVLNRVAALGTLESAVPDGQRRITRREFLNRARS